MYVNPMSEQQEVRVRLSNKLMKEGIGVIKASCAIGIGHTTLNKFIVKGKNVNMVALSKIIKYIESKEKDDH